MADTDRILSQHEVDALLSAIDSGEVEIGAEAATGRQILLYDFKRPERVAREQLRAIETLHEVFARTLQAGLSGLLRTIIDAKVASVDQLTFSEFINSLPNPTVFTVLSCEPLEGSFIFEINPIIAFPIYERLLGAGRSSAVHPERALTDMEWRVMEGVIDLALRVMKEVWANVVNVSFRVRTRESNPQIMQIFSANEPIISVVLELAMGEYKGYLNVGIPVLSIEGVMDKITTHTWYASRRHDESPAQSGSISNALAPAELDVSAHLTIESIRMPDFQQLRPGDLVVTNHPQSAPLLVSVEGRPKFVARLGTVKDHLAVKIGGPIDPSKEAVVLQPRARVGVVKSRPPDAEKAPVSPVDPILAIPVPATVVLAEKSVPLRDVLSLRPGDIIEFAKGVDQTLDLEVTDRKIARGKAMKIGEKFGLQIVEIRDPRETVRALGS